MNRRKPAPVCRGRWLLLAAAALLSGCGLISAQSMYEGVRSTEKARAVVTDKSRSELPPYDQYQKERTQPGR